MGKARKTEEFDFMAFYLSEKRQKDGVVRVVHEIEGGGFSKAEKFKMGYLRFRCQFSSDSL